MDLFELVTKNPNPKFEKVRTSSHSLVARRTMNDVFASFIDPDGNFVEQFQSNGFDARILELYLHAALSEMGWKIDRPKAPDFIVEKNGIRVAIEATTTNPSVSGVLAKHGQTLADLPVEQRWESLQNEWAIRVGGPLTAKLSKRYWEKRECNGLPFVIVIEMFHDPQALSRSHGLVEAYLYGVQVVGPKLVAGRMVAQLTELVAHTLGSKTIPSGFFSLPGTKNISAVIFTNAATTGKFTRMGWRPHGCDATTMVARSGKMWNPDPDVRYATWFAFDLRNPAFPERWTDGMVVMHNPNACRPLPHQVFSGLTQIRGPLANDYIERHVFSSKTLFNPRPSTPFEPIEVLCIPQLEGRALAGVPLPEIVTADYWFADNERRFLGVVTQDTKEPDQWRAWQLAPGDDGRHYPFDECSRIFGFDQDAVNFLQERLAFLSFRSRNPTTVASWIPLLFPRTYAELAASRGSDSAETE
jgi:hypothetical protein